LREQIVKNQVNFQLSPDDLKNSISSWLEKMALGLEPGRFRFCEVGSVVPTSGHFAQVSTCFAMKIAWQTGLWEDWPEQRRKGCIDFIHSFQKKDGFYFDPWLYKNAKLTWRNYASAMLGQVSWKALWERKLWNMRAETRQSASTLEMVGQKPLYPLPCEILSPESVRKYLDSFDWSIPYSAGSNLGHLIFLLSMNRKYFGTPDNYDILVDTILDVLDSFYDKKTGTWYVGSPPDNIKINGAMKILAGFQWLDRELPDTKDLLDFALSQPFIEDGCGFLNRLFVVQQARKAVPKGYRQDDINQLVQKAMEVVMKFYKEDGAFSFYPERSQVNYYFTKVSRGFPVSDLHGTMMMSWVLSVCFNLIGKDSSGSIGEWRCQKA